MNNIILFYSNDDASAKELHNLFTCEKSDIFYFTATQNTIEINYNNGIAVFCSTPQELSNQKLPENTIAVCDPSDRIALEILAKNKIPAVTAGMSGLDTVTISSISETQATVCLLRPLTSINKTTTEPCEFTVKLNKPLSCRAILIYCAVMLLLGKTPLCL